mmetsp:Transcript_41041/g.95085  ORF Transcript_41041/g.95085 Transcript_41041/m.95085 type:complete len:222 (+) Transcript_41041:1235-1900(+)
MEPRRSLGGPHDHPDRRRAAHHLPASCEAVWGRGGGCGSCGACARLGGGCAIHGQAYGARRHARRCLCTRTLPGQGSVRGSEECPVCARGAGCLRGAGGGRGGGRTGARGSRGCGCTLRRVGRSFAAAAAQYARHPFRESVGVAGRVDLSVPHVWLAARRFARARTGGTRGGRQRGGSRCDGCVGGVARRSRGLHGRGLGGRRALSFVGRTRSRTDWCCTG